jgi:hypothetical protein
MTVQSTAGTDSVNSAVRMIESAPRVDTLMGSLAKSGRQMLVRFALFSSDILLAFAMWQAAFVLYSVLAPGLPSGFTLVSMIPVWVGLRAVLGLYPGYGLGQVEELRRQTFD